MINQWGIGYDSWDFCHICEAMSHISNGSSMPYRHKQTQESESDVRLGMLFFKLWAQPVFLIHFSPDLWIWTPPTYSVPQAFCRRCCGSFQMKLWSLLQAIHRNSNTQSENCTHIFSYEVQREVVKTLKGLLWFL